MFNPAFNQALAGRLADDAVIRGNTRWGRFAVALTCDDGTSFRAAMSEAGLSEWSGDDERKAVTISGTPEQWRRVVDEQLHGGLHRAWRYRMLTFAGDRVQMMTFWKSIWRIGVALQSSARGGA